MSWKNEDWATVTIAWNLELLSVWGCHSCKSCQEMRLFTAYISLPDRQTNNEWCYDVTGYLIPSWYTIMLTLPETNSKNPWTSMGLILWHAPFEAKPIFREMIPHLSLGACAAPAPSSWGNFSANHDIGWNLQFWDTNPIYDYKIWQFSTQIWLHTFRWMGIYIAKKSQKFNIPK